MFNQTTPPTPDKLADCPKCGETLNGNIPCWSNLCRIPTPIKCNHDDCLRDGPRPGCFTYQEDKLAEASETLEKAYLNIPAILCREPVTPTQLKTLKEYIDRIKIAQDLVSRAEQKKEDAEKILQAIKFCSHCGNHQRVSDVVASFFNS